MIDETRWYVGQTRPGLGPWAEKNLTAQRERVAEVYCPRVLGPDGEPGGNLFPRYLFVRLRPHPRTFATVNSTRGMRKLLPLGCETPLPLPRDYLTDLRRRVGLMGRIEDAEEVTYDYAHRMQIDVTAGPYAGMSGTFEYRKRGLAVLMMQMMGREARVHVPLGCTRPHGALVSEIQ